MAVSPAVVPIGSWRALARLAWSGAGVRLALFVLLPCLYCPWLSEIRETPRAACVIIAAAVIAIVTPTRGDATLTRAVLLLASIAILASVFSTSPAQSLLGPYPYGPGALLLLAYLVFLIAPPSAGDLPAWIAALALIGAVEGCLALFQVIVLSSDPTGTFGHTMFQGAFTGMAALAAWGGALESRSRPGRIAFVLACGLATAGVTLSARRGPLIALLLGLALLLGRRGARWLRVPLAAVTLAAAVAGAIITVPGEEGKAALRWVGGGDASATLAVRVATYAVALEGITRRPLLGWGFREFRDLASAHPDPAVASEGRVHNVILEVGVATGFLGLVALCLLVAVLGLRARRALSDSAGQPGGNLVAACAAIGIYYLAYLMLNVDQPGVGAWALTMVGFAVTLGQPAPRRRRWRPFVAAAVAAPLIALLALRITAHLALATGVERERSGDFDSALRDYTLARSYGQSDCAADLRMAALQRHVDAAGSALSRTSLLSECATAFPRNAWVHYHLGIALGEAGRQGRRREMAIAHQLAPAQSEFVRGYAQALLDDGEPLTARSVLSAAAARPNADAAVYNDLGVLLLGLGDIAGAVASYERAVALDPENQRYRANLERLKGGR